MWAYRVKENLCRNGIMESRKAIGAMTRKIAR
jgi:hypothetical protein